MAFEASPRHSCCGRLVADVTVGLHATRVDLSPTSQLVFVSLVWTSIPLQMRATLLHTFVLLEFIVFLDGLAFLAVLRSIDRLGIVL